MRLQELMSSHFCKFGVLVLFGAQFEEGSYVILPFLQPSQREYDEQYFSMSYSSNVSFFLCNGSKNMDPV